MQRLLLSNNYNKDKTMTKFWQILEYIQDKMKIISAVCLLAMVFLTCINATGRFFDHPIFGTEEIVGFLAAFVVAMSLPYARKEDAHIGVEILVRLFTAKTQAIIKVITNILSFILFIIATWRIAVYAYTMRQSGEVSMNLQLPEYYVIYPFYTHGTICIQRRHKPKTLRHGL